MQSGIAVLEFRNSGVITQIPKSVAPIPMECKNFGKLDKYILLMMKDEMITMRDCLGLKYSLKVSLGEEA